MNDIDILEDKEEIENFLKRLGYIEEGYLTNGHMSVGNINDINKAIKLIETLISENKELKEKVKEINEEYSAEQKYEMENTIPKSKIEKLIEKLKKEKESKRVLPFDIIDEQNKNINYKIEILQSLLGKE